MKVRMGFISNSSSSSFVLIVKEKTHKEVLKKLDKFDQEIVKQAGSIEKVFGENCYVVGDLMNSGGYSTFDDIVIKEPEGLSEDDYDDWCDNHNVSDSINKYEEVLKEFPKDQSFGWSECDG